VTPDKPIADDILRFIDANVDSIEQLEILRVLGEDDAKRWHVADLAKASQVNPSAIHAHLSALEHRGLIRTESVENQVVCQISPRNQSIAEMLARLLQAYKEHPVTMIRIVYDRADDRLKAFAEAFRLRKEN